jgi:hypothetical protein
VRVFPSLPPFSREVRPCSEDLISESEIARVRFALTKKKLRKNQETTFFLHSAWSCEGDGLILEG